jgi:hypothetical protein
LFCGHAKKLRCANQLFCIKLNPCLKVKWIIVKIFKTFSKSQTYS